MKLPLETQKFIIRQFQPQDLTGFLAFMLDRESTEYLMFDEEQKTQDGATALFEAVCASYNSLDPICSYAIAEKQSNNYVGSCGFAPYDRGILECYYSINKERTGEGIATEIVKVLAETLSKDAEVRAYCHPENFAAHAVAKKCGFMPMGIHKHKHFNAEGELFIYKRRTSR
ncbi:acetyltransferase (GNAT) family protein [Geitlerinema sp. FC II]|nr:acetyltransferase (GNAT) family protein [Geitlerinema sp. FC II]